MEGRLEDGRGRASLVGTERIQCCVRALLTSNGTVRVELRLSQVTVRPRQMFGGYHSEWLALVSCLDSLPMGSKRDSGARFLEVATGCYVCGWRGDCAWCLSSLCGSGKLGASSLARTLCGWLFSYTGMLLARSPCIHVVQKHNTASS